MDALLDANAVSVVDGDTGVFMSDEGTMNRDVTVHVMRREGRRVLDENRWNIKYFLHQLNCNNEQILNSLK